MGVSEKAQADVTVEPAPPVSPPEAPKAKVETEEEKPRVIVPDHLKDKVSWQNFVFMSRAHQFYRCLLNWRNTLTMRTSVLVTSCS